MANSNNMKAQNDPWSPLPEGTPAISQPPADPRHQLIDSDRYIDSLERKLKRIKGKHRPEPSSREIIDSLACFRDDQMRRYMDTDHSTSTHSTAIMEEDVTSSASVSYLQRRLHPERQALNMEELFELLKDDELARIKANADEDSTVEPTAGSVDERMDERHSASPHDTSTSVRTDADKPYGEGSCSAPADRHETSSKEDNTPSPSNPSGTTTTEKDTSSAEMRECDSYPESDEGGR